MKKQTPWRREHLVTLGHSLRFYVITENRDIILFYFVPFCIFFHSVVFQLFTRQPLVYMASVNFSASVYIDPITLSSSEINQCLFSKQSKICLTKQGNKDVTVDN